MPAPDPRAVIERGAATACRGVPRFLLSGADWAFLAGASSPDLLFRSAWSDNAEMHALWTDGEGGRPVIASVAVEGGRYEALSRHHAAAALFERAEHDLRGLEAMSARDEAPLLDHGRWPLTRPLAVRPGPAPWPPEPPELRFFPSEEARGLHQVGFGPIATGLPASGPAHWRLTLRGTGIERVQTLPGYAHRGVLSAVRGLPVTEAAPLVARIAAGGTVAHQLCFSRAAEAALRWQPDPALRQERVLLGEIERIATHLSDLSATLEAAGEAAASGSFRGLLEQVRAGCQAFSGHRWLMAAVRPFEGMRADAGAGAALEAVLRRVLADHARLEQAVRRCRHRLHDRCTIPDPVARAHGLPGPSGRMSGQRIDLRRDGEAGDGAAPAPHGRNGDVRLRCGARLAEIADAASLGLALLERWRPSADAWSGPGSGSGEGIGSAEGPRGDHWHWLRIEHGRIVAAHFHDPAMLSLPAAETAAVGLDADELPLLGRSLGLSMAGVDG
ncbi:Ni Fe-hydrogenase III large subunit-like protein [Rhizosaccharibacter radicis]|uniref:Ni Fe-hydrogenase III large subunit-like protein n=1 Tax=Rhizosaccharibacter radicis TaxID=2782605 RepID=A0ABT1VX94_9PROT|nr:Ni Fe-hydrogenase III large subunit-like protein [Acetobacteraceae bacterium KSS12]